MSDGRTSESRMEFLGYRSASDYGAALEDQWFQTLLRQIERSHERVVPGANDYDFARCRHR